MGFVCKYFVHVLLWTLNILTIYFGIAAKLGDFAER